MSERPQAHAEAGRPSGTAPRSLRPASPDASAAPDTPSRPLPLSSAGGEGADAVASPSSGVGQETPAEHDPLAPPLPSSRISGRLSEAAAPAPPDAAPALDRPGKPVLAGAAIAGLLLVAAPFAVTTGVPGLTLQASAPSGGQGPAVGADTAVRGEPAWSGNTSAVGADTVGGQAAGSTAEETGYVPEVREDGGAAPSLPDPGPDGASSAGAGGGDAVETAPVAREEPASDSGPEVTGTAAESGGTGEDGTGEDRTAPDGDGTGDGGQDTAGDGASEETVTAAGEEPAGDPGPEGTAEEGGGAEETGTEGTGTEDSTAEGSTSEGATGEEAPPEAEGAGGAEETSAGAQEASGPQSVESPDPEGGASVMEDALAQAAADPGPYLAVAGPGCAGSPGSSYRNEGRWDSAEGTASWATRPGGYTQEGCVGTYEAVPVSGDPEHGNGQYAAWTFSPGYAGAVCDLYVHVPDDESPLWIAPGEARYQIFPGLLAEGSAVAVFGFDQSLVRGGWVQVTGFTAPSAEFTVQLTNAGDDPLAGQEHTGAHVAASAVRASCS
ncbi:hypothetical protein ACOALZ_20050 [Nocardiopsis algeriensis]|uniref:hypothetical protein n=1 Tax=Nocardiopsis algeriensis TaxID=1478215 RepID=UPI003B437919